MSSGEDLVREFVDFHGGFCQVKAGDLCRSFGFKRLGSQVRGVILNGLERVGVRVLGNEVPGNQSEVVYLFVSGSPFELRLMEELVGAVTSVGGSG